MVAFTLRTSKDQESLAFLATEVISQAIKEALTKKARVQIALSGGSTPGKAYELLRNTALEWNRVDVFLGDERWVPPTSDESNSLMLRRTLLSSGPGSEACFYPVPIIGINSPEEGAKEFADLIMKVCETSQPILDLVLLGLGEDGHTASLFPGTDSLKEQNSFTTVGRGKGQERITLTAPLLSAAAKVVFLVSGENKRVALKRLLDPNEPFERTPAKLVQPNSEILILADDMAASF